MLKHVQKEAEATYSKAKAGFDGLNTMILSSHVTTYIWQKVGSKYIFYFGPILFKVLRFKNSFFPLTIFFRTESLEKLNTIFFHLCSFALNYTLLLGIPLCRNAGESQMVCEKVEILQMMERELLAT